MSKSEWDIQNNRFGGALNNKYSIRHTWSTQRIKIIYKFFIENLLKNKVQYNEIANKKCITRWTNHRDQ